MTEPILLRPGVYELSFEGDASGVGSGLYVINASDEILFASDFEKDGLGKFVLELSEKPESVRIGVRYDPAYSELRLERISLYSDHVLTKESLLRHGILSFVILLLSLGFSWRWGISQKPLTQKERRFLWVAAVSLVSVYPLLDPSTYVHGEDTFFHLSRIEGIAESLRAGIFPARDQLFWLQGYGYGAGFFYPDLFLYIPAVLRLCGFSLLGVNKFFLVLCVFCGNWTAFAAVEGISGKRAAGMAALFFQAFAAYPLINLYYRGTVGETQAQIFLPLIVWGLYEILAGDPKHWYLFAFGFWGLLNCHLITLAMAGVCVAAVLLLSMKKVFGDKEIRSALLKSAALVLLLGAAFWLPMLEQTIKTPGLRINTYLSTRQSGGSKYVSMPFSGIWTYFNYWDSAYQSLSVFPGWSFGLVLIFRLWAWSLKIRVPRVVDAALILALFLLWACTDLFPWELLAWFANRIQFTWRLLLPLSVLLPLCGGLLFVDVFPKNGKTRVVALGILAFACFFLSAYPILREAVTNRSVSKELFVMQNNRISGSEYMPTKLSAEFVDKNRDTVLPDADGVTITDHKRRGLSFRFRYESDERIKDAEKAFSIPLIYYYGYQAFVTGADGVRRSWPVTKDDMGLVRVEGVTENSAEIEACYVKTPLQWTGEIFSLLSISACVVVFFSRTKKKGASVL